MTTKVADFLGDEAFKDCSMLIVGWEVFRAALRRRVEISAQLPVPLPEAGIATQDGQMVMSLSDLEARWLKEKKKSVASTGDMIRMIKLFVATNGNLPIPRSPPAPTGIPGCGRGHSRNQGADQEQADEDVGRAWLLRGEARRDNGEPPSREPVQGHRCDRGRAVHG